MVQIVNQPVTPNIGGFRHYSGLLPAINGAGDTDHASVRVFAVPAANAAAIFRGDILTVQTGLGGSDLPANIGPPSSTQVVIGNGGGSLLGNASLAPNVQRWNPGDTTSVIAGACVGFGPITLFQAKNGFQFIPATTQAWVFLETDPSMEFQITVPTVPGSAFNTLLFAGADVQANAGFQSTRFGISGLSLNPAIATTATLPLRVLNSSEQIGNDPTSPGFVAKVRFNATRHAYGTAGFVAD